MSQPQDYLVTFRAYSDLSPDPIALTTFDGDVHYANPAGLQLIGLPRVTQSAIATTSQFLTGRGLDVAADAYTVLRARGKWTGYTELRHQITGNTVPVILRSHVIFRGPTEPALIATSISDRRGVEHINAEMAESAAVAGRHAREQKALADLSRFAVTADLPPLFTAATVTAATLIGVGQSSIVHMDKPTDLHLTMDAATGSLGINQFVPSGNKSMMGYTFTRGDRVVCANSDIETRFDPTAMIERGLRSGVGVPILMASGRPWGVLAIHNMYARHYRDEEVSFLESVAGILSAAIRRTDLERELRWRSSHDDLTGLPNRTLAYDVIDGALDRARGNSSLVALLLLDIDDFKIINDSLGHGTGDRALVRFANRLTSISRELDTVARLGGDEFLIVCEGVDSVEHAEVLARHITTSIGIPIADEDVPIPLAASIGIAVSEPDSTRHELIRRADLAMYRAKDGGTGGHAVFDLTDIYDADRIRSLSVDLRSALSANDLTLVYQPVVDIETGTIVAVEALARWVHPTLGPIEPTEFVGVAERTGLATTLGEWALRTACADAARWRTFSDIAVRVNVSALQLRNPGLPSDVAAILSETGLPATALGLEVTETVWVSDTERVADTLKLLHDMGVALLLDDMGKGHSSMSYLDRYPMFECFKIDKSYIARLPARHARAIIVAIIGLARAFNVTVVGEGVETAEQLDALAAAGCDHAQGYLLGRPMTAEMMTERLSR